MKALFLVNAPINVEMFKLVADALPRGWARIFWNLDKWVLRQEIEATLSKARLPYSTVSDWRKRTVQYVLDSERPNVVVMPHDSCIPVDKVFIKECKKRGIPTLYVLHGIYWPSPKGPYRPGASNWFRRQWVSLFGFLRLLESDSDSRKRLRDTWWMSLLDAFSHKSEGHGSCAKIAVFGDAVKRLFVSEGVDSESIVVTGNPKFDYLFHANTVKIRSEICKSFGISAKKRIVLLITGYFVEVGKWSVSQRETFVRAVADATEKINNTQLIIKIHPSVEKEATYKAIFAQMPNQPIICRTTPLWKLLHAADAVVSVNSTAGVEAMAIKKPLVAINLFGDSIPFHSGSGAICIQRKEDIQGALKAALDEGFGQTMDELRDKFVYDYGYSQDGKAAKRIADLIVQMATEAEDRSRNSDSGVRLRVERT
jgi:hypothetical protein